MNEEETIEQIRIKKLEDTISEKDKRLEYYERKINLLQKENTSFHNQIINFEKTFRNIPKTSTQLKKNDVLYFLHIPKTAGTSLITIMDNYFEGDTVLKPHDWQLLLPQMPMDLSKYHFIRGHFGYSILRSLSTKPKCMTLLRNPTDQVLSTLKMIRRQPRDATRYGVSKFDTLSELIINYEIPIIKNPQTMWLLMDQDIFGRVKLLNKEEFENYKPELDEKMFPYQSKDDYLSMATRRLLEFEFVGIVEKMEESLFLLHYTFGWKPIRNFIRENVSSIEENIEEISDEASLKLSKNTILDIELYQYSLDLFNSRYSQMIKELKTKYYEPRFDDMELNDAIFEMLNKHYDEQSRLSNS